jgi:hypothetical protein
VIASHAEVSTAEVASGHDATATVHSTPIGKAAIVAIAGKKYKGLRDVAG